VRIKNTVTSLRMEFSTHKRDLIHWQNSRARVVQSEHPIVVDSECIQPVSKEVKWQGFHFENNHGTDPLCKQTPSYTSHLQQD